MKKLIAELPMLTAPKENEELVIYLAAAKEAISAVLMTERDGKQMPIYFVSHALQGLEINYTPMEKLILALTKNVGQRTNYGGFIVERPEDDSPDTPMVDKEKLPDPWILFEATNNEAEYEALIAGLRTAEQMGVKNLQANVDLRLVANQVNGSYIVKEPGIIKYLEKVKTLTNTFKEFSIKRVPRG
ncbi:reverse transcriptase domain-containing protein [Tanacetum coccineum]